MRIIHLTDLHLRHHVAGTSSVRGRESRQMPAVLERAADLCGRLKPDLGVLSGDLVDVPADSADDPEMQMLAYRDVKLVHDLLQGALCPWVVVPGNHDPAEQVNALFPPVPEGSVPGNRTILFDDQEHEGHVPRRLGRERERFERALQDGDETPQIHIQHYVVRPRLDEGYPHTYVDGEEMSEMIVRSQRVRLVLSGHYHPGVMPFQLSRTWFSVAPALCVLPCPVMVYDLKGDDLAWRRIDLGGAA